MKCACGGETRVIDSRETGVDVRRRRECPRCSRRFTTYEREMENRAPTALLSAALLDARRGVDLALAALARSDEETEKQFTSRDALRAQAYAQAKETGEPVGAIFQRWGCA